MRHWILHPFLIAACAVLALLAHNIGETQPIYALRPLLLSSILAGIAVLLLQLLMHDWRRAAIAASLFLLLFVTYGHIYAISSNTAVSGIYLFRHRTLLPLYILAFLAGIWLIRRVRDLDSWTQILNITSLVVVCLSLVQIGMYETTSALGNASARNARAEASALHLSLPKDQPAPDIYYIILDTYPRNDALAKAFRYDNGWFIKAMEKRGFVFPECAKSNYSFTVDSLTSSLNMNSLDQVEPAATPDNPDKTILYPRLLHGIVRDALENLGYTTVAFETGYSPTEWRDADYYLSPSQSPLKLLTSGITPFETIFLLTNPGVLLYDARPWLPDTLRVFLDGAYFAHRDRIIYDLDRLETDVPAIPGPKLVFAHIMAPHNPFVFGPNGEVLDLKEPFTLNNDQNALRLPDYKHGFRDQVNYLNQRVLEVVDSILSQSMTPPIIIIQGDHGSPRTPEWRMTILNTYFLPGHGADRLYPNISPVNSFRVIFDEYFGGSLPLLPDRQCLSDPAESPFACKPYTDPNPACAALNTP